MAPPATAGVLATTRELLEAAPPDRAGALWRLTPVARQLDANVIRVLPGGRVPPHVEPDLDVLLCVLAGAGELAVGGLSQSLGPGTVAWLPRGSERALAAGPAGLAYVTAHRRRPGLTVGHGSPRAAAEEPGTDEGGEAACFLGRVCPACDRPAAAADARFCHRCGTRLPD